MKNKNLLLFGAVGLVAFTFMGQKKEKYFLVNGVPVAESKLSKPPYNYVRSGGQWWTPAQIAQAASQAGVPPGTTIFPNDPVWATITSILALGAQFIPLIFAGTGTSGSMGGNGNGNGNGGNGSSGGMG